MSPSTALNTRLRPCFRLLAGLLLVLLLGAARCLCESTGGEPGQLHGDAAGLQRVRQVDLLLRSMTVRQAHPRIVVTEQLLASARKRAAGGHLSWRAIKRLADGGDIVNAAFAYLVERDSDPGEAARHLSTVFRAILTQSARPWQGDQRAPDRTVAEWAIAYDWVYDGLTPAQRAQLADKIGRAAGIAGRAAWIRAGNREAGETFHREEWIFWAWRAWPEIALAGDYPDAEFCFTARWRPDWYLGDAARAFAYLNDGTPLEGYQYGADGTSWFMGLKSATGINLVDGDPLRYTVSAAAYQLYGTDFGTLRNVFHHGAGMGAAGLWSYRGAPGETNWKLRESHAVAAQVAAPNDPFQQWFLRNILSFDSRGASSWIFSNDRYGIWKSFNPIANLLFYDPTLPGVDPRTASYKTLPYAKLFAGGKEVYMRSSWGEAASLACFRAAPAFTKTSHGDFDVNTFLLYRKGNLSPDSGVYDTYQGQKNYFGYQKNTVAHNDLLIIDPGKPDDPRKFQGNPDPGGTELVSTRSFGSRHPTFPDAKHAFLFNGTADWGDIVAFESSREFDYAVGEASKAYGRRVEEFSRSILFLRQPSDKAYFVVFDRVKSSNSRYQKKWLLHTVGEPSVSGAITSTEVAGHIYTLDGDSYRASNAAGNSALYGKVLLPKRHRIRKVGGEGYEFWVDGSSPRNWGIDWGVVAAEKEKFMGGPLKEIGEWRLELMPAIQQQRDLFLNVIYLGDVGEQVASTILVESTEGSMTGVLIQDRAKPYLILFASSRHGVAVDGVTYRLPATVSLEPTSILAGMAPVSPYTIVVSTSPEGARSVRAIAGRQPEKGRVVVSTSSGLLIF
jgi:hypothetical protein